MSRTLGDVIRSVSINLGDLYTGTLTDLGTIVQHSDGFRTEGDGWWTGGALSFTSTSVSSVLNLGQERPITNWTVANTTFFTNGFPQPSQPGDQYEIRRRPKHTREAIKEFINQAIREIDRQCWLAMDSYVDDGSTLTYSFGQAMYPVPADMEMVHRVLYQDTLDPWGKLPWYELDQQKWSTNADGNVLIQQLDDYVDWDRSSIPIPDGAALRFMGSRRPAPVSADTDIVDIGGNYLEVYATARMCLRLAEGAQDETDFTNKFRLWFSQQASAFGSTRRSLPSGSRKVR